MVDRNSRPVEQVKYGLHLNCPDIALTYSLARNLLCHPASPCAVVSNISIAAEFTDRGDLNLLYRVIGDIDAIKLPAVHHPGPADNLWQQTCCEAFVATANAEPYREFNFSPSTQWAIYQFAAYRQRDNNFHVHATPHITFYQHADGFELAATIAAELLPAGAVLDIGITTVIEASDGSKSYWALNHGAAQPDFHRRQSFTLALKRNTP